jgi:hypothetical protein
VIELNNPEFASFVYAHRLSPSLSVFVVLLTGLSCQYTQTPWSNNSRSDKRKAGLLTKGNDRFLLLALTYNTRAWGVHSRAAAEG